MYAKLLSSAFDYIILRQELVFKPFPSDLNLLKGYSPGGWRGTAESLGSFFQFFVFELHGLDSLHCCFGLGSESNLSEISLLFFCHGLFLLHYDSNFWCNFKMNDVLDDFFVNKGNKRPDSPKEDIKELRK